MKKLLLSISLVIACTSCNNSKVKKENVHNEKHPHWAYSGETSPEHWAEIEKDADCDGKRQSPINIIDINTQASKPNENSVNILYSPKTILNKVTNNGHSIQFDFEDGDSIQYKGNTYHLSQIHFHEPSEHTINGVRYPLEIHLVNSSKDHGYTVISILAREGNESELFDFFESFIPLEEHQSKEIKQPLNLSTLFPEQKDFYSYGGSLTTPPCTESVNWVIFKNPITVSLDEVLKLKKDMPINNYRTEQPINDRIVSVTSFH